MFNSSSDVGKFKFDLKGGNILNASGGMLNEMGLTPFIYKKKTFDLTRDNIIIKHVPYWGVDDSGIGYIRILKFSKNDLRGISEKVESPY